MSDPTNPYASTPAFAGPAPTPLTVARNPIGTTALILGGALLVLQLISVVTQRALIMSDDYTLIGAVSAVISLIAVLIALPAIALGAIGVTRPGLPRVAAGIGLGIGVSELWAQSLWFVASLLPY